MVMTIIIDSLIQAQNTSDATKIPNIWPLALKRLTAWCGTPSSPE